MRQCRSCYACSAALALVFVLSGCLSVDKDGDVDLDIGARDVVDGIGAVENLVRGKPPIISLPRKAQWFLVAKSPDWTTEEIKVELDQHVPTGERR